MGWSSAAVIWEKVPVSETHSLTLSMSVILIINGAVLEGKRLRYRERRRSTDLCVQSQQSCKSEKLQKLTFVLSSTALALIFVLVALPFYCVQFVADKHLK